MDDEYLDEVSDIEDTSIHVNDDGNDLENPISNADIDNLTLLLLMNKNHYRKYMSQTNPEQYEIENRRIADNRKYRSKIMELTGRLLDAPNTQITTDVDEIFVAYTKRLVQYFKMQDVDGQARDHNGCYKKEDADEDILFGNMDERPAEHDRASTNSFWGKERVIKKGGLPVSSYDMRMFSKR